MIKKSVFKKYPFPLHWCTITYLLNPFEIFSCKTCFNDWNVICVKREKILFRKQTQVTSQRRKWKAKGKRQNQNQKSNCCMRSQQVNCATNIIYVNRNRNNARKRIHKVIKTINLNLKIWFRNISGIIFVSTAATFIWKCCQWFQWSKCFIS